MRRVVRTLELLAEVAGYAGGGMVFALTILITAGVVSRRVLGAPLLAVDEISGYLLLAIVFLGLGYTMKAGGHIRSDVLLAHVPAGVRGALEMLATLLALAFTMALLAGAWSIVAEYYRRGTLSFKYLQIPLWIPASLLLVGVAVLLLQLVASLLQRLRGEPGPSFR